MKKIITLAVTDFKLIYRDPSLRAFLFFPIILFVLVLYFLPNWIAEYDFLRPYISVMLMLAVIENTQMFSFINTMVLIDEKETDVAKIYGVVPMSKIQYLISRFLFPFIITFLLNVIILELQTLMPISWINSIAISFITAMVVPIYALAINAKVKNRIEGMIYVKAINILVLLPLAFYFLEGFWTKIFLLLPTHWIFQSIQNVADNVSPLLTILIGFVFLSVTLVMISRLFLKKHFV